MNIEKLLSIDPNRIVRIEIDFRVEGGRQEEDFEEDAGAEFNTESADQGERGLSAEELGRMKMELLQNLTSWYKGAKAMINAASAFAKRVSEMDANGADGESPQ